MTPMPDDHLERLARIAASDPAETMRLLAASVLLTEIRRLREQERRRPRLEIVR